MILGFKTQINGKPSNFVERIWEGFLRLGIKCSVNEFIEIGKKALPEKYLVTTFSPKIHTIREDKKNRWKAGMMIDFFINVRTEDMFRFAPRVPVTSIQKITMSYSWNYIINIWINGRELTPSERLKLAINDGFDSWEEFFEYFYPLIKSTEDNFWKGKIIHWTDLKY